MKSIECPLRLVRVLVPAGLAVAVFGIGCSFLVDSDEAFTVDGRWHTEGLADRHVTVMKKDGSGLLVGTETGLFRRANGEIESLGLEEHEIKGVVRTTSGALLASIGASSVSSGDTTLFRSTDGGHTWEPFLSNFGGSENENTWIEKGPIKASPHSDTLFVRGSTVIRSPDGGQSWTPVFGKWESWGGVTTLLKADSEHPGLLWVSGLTAISAPYLWRSRDYGETWEHLDALAYDLLTQPTNSDHLLVAMGGGVQVSGDGGKGWTTVFTDAHIRTLAHSERSPEVIYASGEGKSSTKPFFITSADFGETWERQTFEEGPSSVTTTHLVVQERDGQEVLVLGTNGGMFSFRVE